MKTLSIYCIRLYQLCIRPLIGDVCRFHPSCSDYAIEALSKHGFFKGTWLMVKRLCKCHQFHPGGYDPVPEKSKDSSGS